ncbi:hypothetical protein NQK81_13270 [Amycolatopsis roodepoortensis]|uniref:hypothetical protein n=1 Tax=Amycolatopsis roodepoortensis TaxID=700274 RepID=UPI00214CEDA1|nr:hypothetical protein [Amycolatopsis roodepoortensis]UUV34375.1 hypothetical protein NQK81_13270 [Amycolatopsis roodepoortensis]
MGYHPDVAVEMLLGGGWTDVTNDVRVADKIKIKRGRSNETAEPEAPVCTFTLDNTGGKYSPRNPMSPYYPTLGRNTPMRVAIRTAKDAFARTVSNGWGPAPVGGTWSTVGTPLSDFAVVGGTATHLLPTTLLYHATYLGSQLYRDVDVAVTVSMPFANVTGGSVEPANLILSGLSTSDYFMVSLSISASEAVTIGIVHVDGTTVAASTTVAGLTYSGQALRVRAQVDGQTIRAKVWPAASAEPYGWAVKGRTTRLVGRAAGWVGVRSGVSSGNTNVPVTFSYSAFEVRSNRFAGEIAAFPPEWDASGNNVYSRVQASGLLRRITQGEAPLKSTYRRGNETISPPHLAYWPVEEGTDATSIASGIGGDAMTLTEGKTTFASNSDFRGSAPIAKSEQSRWTGLVPAAAPTGQLQLVFLMSMPTGGEINTATFAQLQTTGTAAFIDLFYDSGGGGGFKLTFYNAARSPVFTFGPSDFQLRGRPVQVSLELTQNGANIDFAIATFGPGDVDGAVINATAPGLTIGAARAVVMNVYRQTANTSYGHVAVRNQITSIFTNAVQLNAYHGETTATRILRVFGENGLPVEYVGGGVTSAQLGYQGRQALTELVREAAAADMGSLYDSRNTLGFLYRNRSSLYNQPAVLALDYSAPGHVAPPLRPVEDDAALRNDVTVTRRDGSSYQAVETTGRLAVTDPASGAGVGRYDDAVTLNLATDLQTPSAASWLLHLGTIDEARYPAITVKLAALAAVSPTLALAALMVNLDDKITVAHPKAEIDPTPIAQIVRGYTETIGATSHDLVFGCAPASAYEVVKLDTAVLGKLDTATSVLLRGVTSSATQLLISDYPGPGWTSDPAQMPIPITVGGEDMSVTAISAIAPSFVGAGAAVTGNNTSLVPPQPAGVQPDDVKLIFASIRNSGAGAVGSVPGWGLLFQSGNIAVLVKPHEVGDVSPTVPFVGGVAGADTIAQMVVFRGVSPRAFPQNAGQLNAAAQNIAYPGAAISDRNAVVLYLGWKQDDWTSVATLGGATEIGEPVSTAGDDSGLVWDYTIQTVPANVPAGSFTVTGGASAISRGGVIVLDGGAQRMTVTRSVNGVVKSHAAGAKVSLTRPARLGL